MGGIQHEGAHARVFRGLNGENTVVQLRKRQEDYNDNLHRFIHRPVHNTNHGNIKLNVPEGFSSSSVASADKSAPTVSFAQKAQVDDDDDVETVYSVVYQTMSQTFDGTPAGYVTESATPATAEATKVAQTSSATATQDADEADYESRKAAAQAAPTSSATSVATGARDPAAQHAALTASASSVQTTASLDAAEATVAVGNAGMSTADSAAVVGGVPLQATRSPAATQQDNGLSSGAKAGVAFGVIIGLGLLAGLIFFCMRRKKNKDAQREAVDEKFNEKSGFGAQTNRFSADSGKQSTVRNSAQASATAPRLSLRPVTQFLPNLSNNAQNSNNALGSLANTPMAEKPSPWERRPQNATENPFSDAPVLSEKQANPFDEGDGSAHDRSNSFHSQSSSISTSEPPTPGQVGTAAAVSVARGPNDVHRVQLDFKPSMEDELELISGQLVRMLHEYDDGWALCIRMDRTQQGVVPRTCLSKLPVKPRGPPRNHSNHSSQSSASLRNPPQGAMAPRPLTPTRDQSPAGQGQRTVERKPVPGMAM